MEYVLNALKNPYISGVIVFVLTWPLNNWLSKKSDKNGYFVKVKQANANIMGVLIEYIISFRIINKDVVNEIINAVSIERGIDKKELFGIEEVRSILIKEIVKMRLVESKDKSILIENIMNNLVNTDVKAITDMNNIDQDIKTRNNKAIKIEAPLLGTMMTIIVSLIITTYISMIDNDKLNYIFYNQNECFLIISICILVILVEIILLILIREKRKRKKSLLKDIERYNKKYKKYKDNCD